MTAPAQPSDGRWRVRTENSVYLLDFEAKTVQRASDVHSMRWDNLSVALSSVSPLTVGHPMYMTINPRVDERGPIVTIRCTSNVLGWERDA